MSWDRAPALSFQEQKRMVVRDYWIATTAALAWSCIYRWRGFGLKQFAGCLPFVEDLAAAY